MTGKGVWLARWRRFWRRFWRWAVLAIVSAIAIVGTWRAVSLAAAARAPSDAWLVLGGSIKREMYVAERANERGAGIVGGSPLPILISTGSDPPCLWALFQREGVDLGRIWIEECARSTFENFAYSVPVLVNWQARHVKMTTSGTHYRRAMRMARIAFGMRGIWVEFDTAPEVGVPANSESQLKTVLDVTRTIAWSLVAPLSPIRCGLVANLTQMDWVRWRDSTSFACEAQGQVRPEELPPGLEGLLE